MIGIALKYEFAPVIPIQSVFHELFIGLDSVRFICLRQCALEKLLPIIKNTFICEETFLYFSKHTPQPEISSSGIGLLQLDCPLRYTCTDILSDLAEQRETISA